MKLFIGNIERKLFYYINVLHFFWKIVYSLDIFFSIFLAEQLID